MNKKINLHIAEPCHENWDNMNKVEQGRFCGSCAKNVIDFSLMNDRQILDYFAKAKGSTCGRFTTNQLDRPMDNKPGVKKVSIWKWVVTVWMSVWLGNNTQAQSTKSTPAKSVEDNKNDELEVVVVGMTFTEYTPVHTVKKTVIEGVVYDEHNNVLAGATISMAGKAYGISDTAGKFSFEKKIKHSKDSIEIQVSYLGYATEKIKVAIRDANAIEVRMKILPEALKEVVVTGYETISCRRVTGSVSIGRRVTLWNNFTDTLQKVTGNGMFKVYPNPAVKGRFVNIIIKESGDYSLQLITNASQIITSQKVTAAKGQTVQLNTSANLAAGIYYVRMVNEKTKKQYTDKLLLMSE